MQSNELRPTSGMCREVWSSSKKHLRLELMNEQRLNEELDIMQEHERVKEKRYQEFQEWLNKCPLVITDYNDFTTDFQITFSLSD